MNARRLLAALCILPCLALLAQAQTPRQINAGTSPAFLFADPARGHVHVITAGTDAGFDGILEPGSGDIAPRWYVIDAATEQIVDSMVFDAFFSFYPIRPGVDLKGDRLYVAQLGRVRAYDLTTLALTRDTVVLGSFAAVSFDTLSGLLVLADRVGADQPGYVHFVDPGTGVTVAAVQSGIAPSMTGSRMAADGLRVEHYTLNEGTFGQGNSSISYTSLLPDVYGAVSQKQLGGGGFYVATLGDRAYVLLRAAGQIQVIDTRTHQDVPFSPISFASTPQTGPYTLAFQGDSILLVGMYSARMYRIRTDNGAIVDSIMLPGGAESIAVHDSLAFVTSKVGPAGAGHDSSVTVVNLNTWESVDTLYAGSEPLAVFTTSAGDIHVLGNRGEDEHFWTVFDGETWEQKSTMSFTGRIDIPLHPFYDAATDSVYIVIADSLRAYGAAAPDAGYRTLYTDRFDSSTLGGVFDGDGYLFLTETGPFNGPGPEYVHVLTKGGAMVAKFLTGRRPTAVARVHSARDGAIAIYVIDRSAPMAKVSDLDFFEFLPDILHPDTLGNGANHLNMQPGGGIVTLNGSHQIAAVNFDEWQVHTRVPTGTSGYDGPRESLMLPGNLVVATTYAGDVRVFNVAGDSKTYPIGGKAEGITAIGEKVFVARAFAPDYSADSVVVVFNAGSLVASVERVKDIAAAMSLEQNYPNPATDATMVGFGLTTPEHVTLAVYTANGELVETLVDERMEAGTYSVGLRTSALPSGSYIYTLRAGSEVLSRVMKVVR